MAKATGRRSSARSRRSGCGRSCATRTGARTGALAAICCLGCLRCGLCDGKLYARPRADGHPPLCVRERPDGWLREDHDRCRAVGVVHGRGGAASARLARARRELERPPARWPRSAGWQTEIEQAEEQLDELAELWASEEISRPEWLKAARRRSEQRQDLARKRLARLEPHERACGARRQRSRSCGDRWAGLTLTRQQQIVAAVLDHLIVGPGTARLATGSTTRG